MCFGVKYERINTKAEAKHLIKTLVEANKSLSLSIIKQVHGLKEKKPQLQKTDCSY